MAIAIYDQVQLQIFAPDAVGDDFEACVVDRGDEMILEVPAQKETPLITIELNYDLGSIREEEFWKMLPKEFEKYKASASSVPS